jgi:hypothetical protein
MRKHLLLKIKLGNHASLAATFDVPQRSNPPKNYAPGRVGGLEILSERVL